LACGIRPHPPCPAPSGERAATRCDTASGVSAGHSTSDAPEPARPFGLKLLLPVAVLLVVIGGVTLLLVGGGGKTTLPGNASTVKVANYQGLVVSPRQPAPPLSTLRNYDGSSFDLAADRGKAVFVTFLYSHCPDVCPLMASQLHAAYGRMTPALRKQVAIVAVSVDPHGDSARAVADFVRSHQLRGEARYLIGSPKGLASVWEAWKVGSQKDTSNPKLVNHSALIYGISASGQLTTIYPANFLPSQIVHDVTPLLAS
jgi:protein SCO1/2